jgi:hypothetical protein
LRAAHRTGRVDGCQTSSRKGQFREQFSAIIHPVDAKLHTLVVQRLRAACSSSRRSSQNWFGRVSGRYSAFRAWFHYAASANWAMGRQQPRTSRWLEAHVEPRSDRSDMMLYQRGSATAARKGSREGGRAAGATTATISVPWRCHGLLTRSIVHTALAHRD